MTVAIIIQARYGSTRLPGKVFLDLGGKPVVRHVIDRCKRVKRADSIWLAIPETEIEEHISAFMWAARHSGVDLVAGPERDVLKRYWLAMQKAQADHIVRITADCPLVDPDVVDTLIQVHLESGADYCSNVAFRTFPRGLDCEIFTAALLDRAHEHAIDLFDREHVTPWMREPLDVERRLTVCAPPLDHLRWTLDTPEDYVFLKSLFAKVPNAGDLSYHAILQELSLSK